MHVGIPQAIERVRLQLDILGVRRKIDSHR